jgi:hypothetical protein
MALPRESVQIRFEPSPDTPSDPEGRTRSASTSVAFQRIGARRPLVASCHATRRG